MEPFAKRLKVEKEEILPQGSTAWASNESMLKNEVNYEVKHEVKHEVNTRVRRPEMRDFPTAASIIEFAQSGRVREIAPGMKDLIGMNIDQFHSIPPKDAACRFFCPVHRKIDFQARASGSFPFRVGPAEPGRGCHQRSNHVLVLPDPLEMEMVRLLLLGNRFSCVPLRIIFHEKIRGSWANTATGRDISIRNVSKRSRCFGSMPECATSTRKHQEASADEVLAERGIES